MVMITSVALFATRNNETALPSDSGTGRAEIGGAFILTDQNGNRVSDEQFRGKYMLVFFGFTHCPDICPVAMATYTAMLPMLADNADKIAPIFITIDAKNDTPEQLKSYLSNFDPRIIGLTGSERQIADVAALYKTYYAESHQGHGMMDHSSLIYLMDKNGDYITHFPHTIAPETLAEAINEQMKK